MNRKLLILLLCCVAVLVPSIASAQFFEKQKVVVWEVFDRNNDVKVAQSTKQQIRTSIVDAFVNSRNYEAFEANMNDVKSRISAKGLTPSPGNIATAIRELYGVDFVIFTNVQIIQHSNSFDDFKVHLASQFFSTETQKSERMFYVDMKSNVNEIPSACAKLLAGLLGEQGSSQSSAPQQNQQWQSQPQQSVPQQSYQPAAQPRPQQPAGKQIGDIIYHNGVMSIVIAVDSSGQHGMLLSVDVTWCHSSNAEDWLEKLGSEWHLPNRSQLRSIYRNKDRLNAALEQSGFGDISEGWYWTSEWAEGDSWSFVFNMSSGNALSYRTVVEMGEAPENNHLCVRAVATF